MPSYLVWVILGIGALGLLLLVDRLLLRLESRGLVYYRRRRASPGTSAAAFLEVHAHLRPSVRLEVEERRTVRRENDDQGDQPRHPASPGSPR
ncbi:MAG: hypothetical protein ACM3O7_04090 [Acidobacteriota bacterium]